MNRLFVPLLLLLALAVACDVSGAAPTTAPATQTPFVVTVEVTSPPPTSAPATAAPATVSPATPHTEPATSAPKTAPASPTEPPATSAATSTLKVVLRAPDNTVKIVDTGLPAAGVRRDQGLLPMGGSAGDTAYVLDFTKE